MKLELLKGRGGFRLGLIALTLVAALTRLVGVSHSPPGFYIDEAAIGAQVLCLAQSGETLQGTRFPLFAEVLGGGFVTPGYLYPAAGWSRLFGGSIESLRLFSAFASLLFLAGVFVFSRRFWDSPEAAWLATLAAAISPWVFQFARIAWDPAVAPAYLAWAFALLWGNSRKERALAGLLFALAAYAYPPLRVQIAIALPLAILYLVWRRREWRPYLLTVAVALLASLPLVQLTLSGEIQGRFAMLSVFNPVFLEAAYGTRQPLMGVYAIFGNLGLLLAPGYLLVSGDANLRHSTGAFGIWSWLDALAMLTAAAALILMWRRFFGSANQLAMAGLVLVGYLAGILPAAMTWEGNPHALRSIGATLFLALGTGGLLFTLWQRHVTLRLLILAVAALFLGYFQADYHLAYPARAADWFDARVVQTADQLARTGRLAELAGSLQAQGIHYDPRALRYFELRDGVSGCGRKPD